MNVEEYAEQHGIRLEVLASRGRQVEDDGWQHYAFDLRLHHPGHHTILDTPWKQGLGHTGEPNVRDVLDSLVSDAQAYQTASSFEDFADEFGYDRDSRRAERTYLACGDLAKRLLAFLDNNPQEFDHLLYEVERL